MKSIFKYLQAARPDKLQQVILICVLSFVLLGGAFSQVAQPGNSGFNYAEALSDSKTYNCCIHRETKFNNKS